jgi:hypothetical protein
LRFLTGTLIAAFCNFVLYMMPFLLTLEVVVMLMQLVLLLLRRRWWWEVVLPLWWRLPWKRVDVLDLGLLLLRCARAQRRQIGRQVR